MHDGTPIRGTAFCEAACGGGCGKASIISRAYACFQRHLILRNVTEPGVVAEPLRLPSFGLVRI
jgi:hypothetical protein